jgi:hypothetical protein
LQAKASLNNREELVAQAILELEYEMELLGITGVEGKPIISSKLINLLFSYRQTTK